MFQMFVKCTGLLAAMAFFLNSPAAGQFLATRQCTNTTAQSTRCLSASNTLAASACSSYCGSSGQNGTALYNYFCTAANKTCGLTSYCYNAPLLFNGQTVVPTLTASTTFVDVPCGFSGANYPLPITLTTTSGGNQTYLINQQVISSSPMDGTTGYVAVFPSTGVVVRGPNGPAVDTTQTIAFTAYQRGSGVYSNTVQVTFVFHSCALQISCGSGNSPSSASPNTPCFNYDSTLVAGTFPQITCTITNAPQTLPVVWDQPGNLGATQATLNLAQNCQQAPVACTAYAPAVINGTDLTGQPPTATYINIINENAQGFGVNPTGLTGIYGPNPSQGTLPVGCQYLLISAVPQTPQAVPYVVGSKVIEVCASPTVCPGPTNVPTG